jgi:hypothetical protein
MYLVNPITTTTPLYRYERQFAHLGNSTNNNNNLRQQGCPTCKNKNISLIPLAKDERYTITMELKRGVEMEFAKLSR